MALTDRLGPNQGVEHIAVHTWSAAMGAFAMGELTRTQIVEYFAISVEDQVQLDQLIAFYQGLTTAEKAKFHGRLEIAGNLFEVGAIGLAKYKSILGMT